MNTVAPFTGPPPTGDPAPGAVTGWMLDVDDDHRKAEASTAGPGMMIERAAPVDRS